MRTVDEILFDLKSLDLSTYPVEDANYLMSELRQKGFSNIVLQPNLELYRMRPGIGYREKKDFSYKPEECCTKCQRASLRGNTVFYGIIGNDDKDQTASAEYVGMCECSDLLWETNVNQKTEMISCGRWLVTEPLHMVSMIHPDIFPDINNPWLEKIKSSYKKHRFNEGFDTIQKFFSTEFSKPVDREQDYNYLISALFSYRVINEYGLDGVVYPSQRCEGKVGLNVALSKSAVDNGKVDLVKIYELKCYRYKRRMRCVNVRYIDYPNMDEHVVATDDNEIWEDLKNNQ